MRRRARITLGVSGGATVALMLFLAGWFLYELAAQDERSRQRQQRRQQIEHEWEVRHGDALKNASDPVSFFVAATGAFCEGLARGIGEAAVDGAVAGVNRLAKLCVAITEAVLLVQAVALWLIWRRKMWGYCLLWLPLPAIAAVSWGSAEFSVVAAILAVYALFLFALYWLADVKECVFWKKKAVES